MQGNYTGGSDGVFHDNLLGDASMQAEQTWMIHDAGISGGDDDRLSDLGDLEVPPEWLE